MIRCSRVGQYIECTGKITIRKTDDKTILYAIWLCGSVSEFLHKSWFSFPYNKGISGVFPTELSTKTWFRQPISHSPNNYKLPTINYQSGVESLEIDPIPEAQVVRNRGHG
jgi:hypothetical protein